MTDQTNKILQQVGAAGTSAVIAVTFIHPIDLVKTRLQISGTKGSLDYMSMGVFETVKNVIKNEGVGSFWKGINAAWLRESSYTSLRLGLYEPCKNMFNCTTPENSTFSKKFAAGSTAGILGSFAGNPFDVLKTKMMTHSGKVQPSMIRISKHITSTEGLGGFYKGFDSNIMRAMVLNGTKMSCYDQIKTITSEQLNLSKSSLINQFISAIGAGFFMATTVAPFDMVRTRLMNQIGGDKEYKNSIDCFQKIVKNEGVYVLWRGWLPIWCRFAPTTTIQLVVFEQLRKIIGMDSL